MTSKNSGSVMLILSSPSGGGKTTLTKKIQQKFQNFNISISHTTRKPRPNEVEGIDYFFINHEEFEKKISNNEFYEYAKIFDNFYVYLNFILLNFDNKVTIFNHKVYLQVL